MIKRPALALLATFVLTPFACSADKEPDKGGLMLIVAEDGALALDRVVIDIGSNGVPVRSADLRVPADTALPTSLGITTNGNEATSVTIAVSGFRGDTAIDRRDLLVKNVPVDHVSTVNVLLSARCTSLVVKEGTLARSLCPQGATCNPETATCTSGELDGDKLPPYDPTKDPTRDASGTGEDAEAGASDAPGDARGGLVTCAASTEKRCDNKCVSVFDPAYGCGGPTCAPCALDGSTVWTCNAGKCSIATCAQGFKLCGDKCVAVDDPLFGCGATTCAPTSCPGGAPALTCQNGTCTSVATCPTGTRKCRGNFCLPPDRAYGCESPSCIACSGTDTCQGSPLACKCTPDNVTACKDKECGPTVNNCGETITCPDTCGPAAACVGNFCGCVPEAETSVCAGKCGRVIDNCGRPIDCPNICTPNVEVCGIVTPNKCDVPPSCAGGGSGKDDCRGESCCTSIVVPGGPFKRQHNDADPASISTVRIEKYKVTVARFDAFMKAWIAGWRPASGAGKHLHLNGGQGLFTTRGATPVYETGWNTAHASQIPTTQAVWEPLVANSNYGTYGQPNSGKLPISMVSWYEAAAFCIWDGGFLPTYAELNYAAEGGTDNRTYPWGESYPTANEADFCPTPDSGSAVCNPRPLPVGSKTAGDGKWGHADIVGGVWTWVLDQEKGAAVDPSCADDCVGLGGPRYLKISGSSSTNEATLPSSYFVIDYPEIRAQSVSTPGGNGFRCARVP